MLRQIHGNLYARDEFENKSSEKIEWNLRVSRVTQMMMSFVPIKKKRLNY